MSIMDRNQFAIQGLMFFQTQAIFRFLLVCLLLSLPIQSPVWGEHEAPNPSRAPQADLDQALLTALEKNDLPAFQDLLKRGANPYLHYTWSEPLTISEDSPYWGNSLAALAIQKNNLGFLLALDQMGFNFLAPEFKQGYELLELATEHGLEKVEFFLKKGVKPFIQEQETIYTSQETSRMAQRSVLAKTVEDPRYNTISLLLLQAGAPVNPAPAYQDMYPLIMACRGGNLEMVKLLLKKGANREQIGYAGYTALTTAAEYGHEAVVSYLLSQGAKFNAKSIHPLDTPLTWALKRSEVLSRYVLKHQPQWLNQANQLGELPLEVAITEVFTEYAVPFSKRLQKDLVPLLLSHGAKLDLLNLPFKKALHHNSPSLLAAVLKDQALYQVQAKIEGEPVLIWATRAGFGELIPLLLQAGFAVNGTDREGRSALYWAADGNLKSIAETLLKSGAEIDLPDLTYGRTPLIAAAEKGHLEMVQFLLINKANLQAQDQQGLSAIMWAAREGRTEVVKYLLAQGANLTQWDHNARQALQVAASNHNYPRLQEDFFAWQYDHLKGLQLSIQALLGQDLNHQDRRWKRTALIWAAEYNNLGLCEKLIQVGAALDLQDLQGQTALIRAAYRGHIEIVKQLLTAGANPAIRDQQGMRARDWAEHQGHIAVMALL